jgi:phosphatidylserine/phosphatidylglycerophosphate/cardiolipin synthase-like enzyme
MMLLEQLVTAGTTTSRCVQSLIRRFRHVKFASVPNRALGNSGMTEPERDLEAGHRVGRLRISYFRPRSQDGSERRLRTSAPSQGAEEPVHSHLKLTVVDGEYTVLGSGNMDRASWFTSQELGIMFYSRDFCATVESGVEDVLEGRLELVFDSESGDGEAG